MGQLTHALGGRPNAGAAVSCDPVRAPRTGVLGEDPQSNERFVTRNPPPLPPRLLGDRGPANAGPVLITLGAIHGNEPAGMAALQRIFKRLDESDITLAGRFIGLAGNRKAFVAGQRYLDLDLNRAFQPQRLERLRDLGVVGCLEEAEVRELDERIRAIVDEAGGRQVHLFDVHSTSGSGAPFGVVDDILANRNFAFAIPVTHVLGLEEELAGTVTSYANRLGLVALAFESGQHDEPESVDRAEAAIWIALETSGVLPAGRPEVEASRRLLRAESSGLPHVVEVRHRHALQARQQFHMEPGFRNFDSIHVGQLLATDHGEPVKADTDALVLMPLYQGQGDEGFFVVHEVNTFWLRLSAWLRRTPIHGWLHLLPGVSRYPERPNTLLVDRHRARFLALPIFHLLGYRRELKDARTLVMTRRDRD